jgi:hypothetical protein
MKNKKITDAYERVKLNESERQLIWEKVTAKRQHKRRVIPAFAAIAAALAVVILVYSLIPGQTGNSFAAAAYTIGYRADGTTERIELDMSTELQEDGAAEQIKVDLSTSLSGLGSVFSDGLYLYINIVFDITGENIKSAEFSIVDGAAQGFFARQLIDNDDVRISVRDGPDSRLNILFGTEFELLGDRMVLEDMEPEKYSYAIALTSRYGLPTRLDPYLMYHFPPEALGVQIDVMFEDGETQTQLMSLNFSGGSRRGFPVFS